jgi:hypothetical protein
MIREQQEYQTFVVANGMDYFASLAGRMSMRAMAWMRLGEWRGVFQ